MSKTLHYPRTAEVPSMPDFGQGVIQVYTPPPPGINTPLIYVPNGRRFKLHGLATSYTNNNAAAQFDQPYVQFNAAGWRIPLRCPGPSINGAETILASWFIGAPAPYVGGTAVTTGITGPFGGYGALPNIEFAGDVEIRLTSFTLVHNLVQTTFFIEFLPPK